MKVFRTYQSYQERVRCYARSKKVISPPTHPRSSERSVKSVLDVACQCSRRGIRSVLDMLHESVQSVASRACWMLRKIIQCYSPPRPHPPCSECSIKSVLDASQAHRTLLAPFSSPPPPHVRTWEISMAIIIPCWMIDRYLGALSIIILPYVLPWHC